MHHIISMVAAVQTTFLYVIDERVRVHTHTHIELATLCTETPLDIGRSLTHISRAERNILDAMHNEHLLSPMLLLLFFERIFIAWPLSLSINYYYYY